MAERKACFYAILAAILAFTPLSRLNSAPEPSDPDLAMANGLYVWRSHRATNQEQRSYSVKPPEPKSETLIFLPVQSLVTAQSFLAVQSKDSKDLREGKLLVASRDLADPNFAQAVILLVHFDEEGVVGLILNRRSHVPLAKVLEDLPAAKDLSDPVYLGGPVETSAVFALLRSPTKVEGAEHIFDQARGQHSSGAPVAGGVYMISDKTLFEKTISSRPNPNVFHVYLGYAGWTAEQLQREVEMGAWFIFPADINMVFNSDPDSLWKLMIQKTELRVARSKPLGADP